MPREALEALESQLARLSEAAAEVARRLAGGIDLSGGEAAVRERLLEELLPVAAAAALDAASYAADFYDGVREASVGSRLGALPEPGSNPAATGEAMRAFAGQAASKGREWLASRLAERIDWEVRSAALRCVAANGSRDPMDVRYARVPSEPDPCWFCCLVASNGFFYKGADTARTHAHCKCAVVPGFRGETRVEGYDPDEYYALWSKAMDEGVTSYEKLNEMSAKAKRRRRSPESASDAEIRKYGELRRIRAAFGEGRPARFVAPAPRGGGNASYAIPPGLGGADLAAFGSRLGLGPGHEDELAWEVARRAAKAALSPAGDGAWEQTVTIPGPNGKRARVTLTWDASGGSPTLAGARLGRWAAR